MIAVLIAALAAAHPSAESIRLAREIAHGGTLATLLPMIQAKEVDELVAAHPELSAADNAGLRATAKRVYEQGREKLLSAEAEAFARRLSLTDLRAIAAFERSSAARHYRSASPQVIAATMQAMGTMDYKRDVMSAFCKESGKLCEAK
jgi:hypothetical protein